MSGFSPSLQVGLFPLPNVVLLPCNTLPLQVFEPRYRAMVRDAIDGHGMIAMALLCPGYEGYYHTNLAAIHPVVCLGRIREHIQTPDGRYFINLLGLARSRIRAEDCSGEYRLATLEPIAEAPAGVDVDGEFRVRRLLIQSLGDPVFQSLEGVAELQQQLSGCRPLGEAIDSIAGSLLAAGAVEIRQRILEQTDVLERAETLVAELHILQRTLQLQHETRQTWPRFGSMN